MHRSRSAFLGSLLAASAATPGVSQEICNPVLSSKASDHTEVVNLRRQWTAVFVVDASRCAAKTGVFEIDFVRLKDVGPDLAFTERFTWRAGQTEVTLDLTWDEWVNEYRIGEVWPCPCR